MPRSSDCNPPYSSGGSGGDIGDGHGMRSGSGGDIGGETPSSGGDFDRTAVVVASIEKMLSLVRGDDT